VHPSKSCLTSTRIAPSFRSQEPRRPRFSFFNLHNVKELTHRRHRPIRRLEAGLPVFFQGTRSCVRLPGRSSALSDCVDQWEQQVLASSTLAGCIRDDSVCQHPVFVFRQSAKFETLKLKFAFSFRNLPSSSPPSGAALFSDGRVIVTGISLGKPPDAKNRKIRPPNDRPCGKPDQHTRDLGAFRGETQFGCPKVLFQDPSPSAPQPTDSQFCRICAR
jgi:hypothetical protein